MKVAIITHHFPPIYHAGAEQYAYRLAKMLIKMGVQVKVICIETVKTGSLKPESRFDVFDDIDVYRLSMNLEEVSNPLEIGYRNPALGEWIFQFLSEYTPDIVHINSGYLIGGSVIEAAHSLKIPIALTLHEYWFLCKVHTLIRTDGKICEEACPPERCAWCHLSNRRRYRYSDKVLNGMLGNAFIALYQKGILSKVNTYRTVVETMRDRKIYLRSILEKVDLIISPSRFLIQKFDEWGMQVKPFKYLPFGLANQPEPVAPVKESSQTIVIGYMGQIAPHKGIHILINAFKRLKPSDRNIQLKIFGKAAPGSRYGESIIRQIKNHPDIQYAGSYDNAKVGEVLNSLDLVIVPSTWYENRPTVIIEALSMKVPVIASKIGGMTELIEDGKNGLLFTPGSTKELHSCLQRIIDEPDLLPRLRDGIEKQIRLEDEIKEIVDLYKELIDNKDAERKGSLKELLTT